MATIKRNGTFAIAVASAALLLGCTDDGTATGSTVDGSATTTAVDSPTTTEATTSTSADDADAPGTTTATGTSDAVSAAAATATAVLDRLDQEGLITMGNVLDAVGLLDDERLRDGYTVLAPTDEVFSSLPASELAQIAANPTSIRPLLERHVVPEVIEPGDLAGRSELRTLGGQTVTVEAGDPIRVGGAEVLGGEVIDEDGRVAVYKVGALVGGR